MNLSVLFSSPVVSLIWNVILLKRITWKSLKTVFSLKYKETIFYEYHAKEGKSSSLWWCFSGFHISRLEGTWHYIATSDPAPLNPQYPKLKQSFHNGPWGIPKLSQTQAAFVIWTNQYLMLGCLFSGLALFFKQKLCWQVLWLRKNESGLLSSSAWHKEKENFFFFFLTLLCKMKCMALTAFGIRRV